MSDAKTGEWVKGTEAVIHGTGLLIDGLRCKVLRQSPRTGAVTVELREGRGAWDIGDVCALASYELRRVEVPR